MDESILIKTTPQKNKPARFLLIFGIVILLFSFIQAMSVYNTGEGYGYATVKKREYNSFLRDYRWVEKQERGRFPLTEIYPNFRKFFFQEFFDFDYLYGYMFLLGISLLIAGIIMNTSTKNSQITVKRDSICGKKGNKPEVQLPLQMITGVKPGAFHGVTVLSFNAEYRFPCIQNRDEVIQVISRLLTARPGDDPTANLHSDPASSTSDFD